MSDSVRPQRRQPTRLPHPWDSPGKNTGVDCHFLLQGNLPDPGIEPRSPALQADALTSEPPGKQYIMRNAGLEEAQAGIKIARRNLNNLRYADDTTLMAESEEELKSLLMKVKVESEKVGLKLNI